MTFISDPAAACASAANLAGREEMMARFSTHDYAAFVSAFKMFCRRHQSKVMCKTERVSQSNSARRQREFTRADRCAEVFDVPSGATDSVLYLVTDRT